MDRDPAGESSVRRAIGTDAPAIARLRGRSWRATYAGLLPEAVIDDVVGSQAAWAARIRGRIADPSAPDSIFVVEADGRVVGVAIWAPSADADATAKTAEVRAIYLDPDAIGHGHGRTLFAVIVADIAKRGFDTATLWVLESNVRARRFYEVAGWQPDGATKIDRRPGGTLHEVRYRRALDMVDAPGGEPQGRRVGGELPGR